MISKTDFITPTFAGLDSESANELYEKALEERFASIRAFDTRYYRKRVATIHALIKWRRRLLAHQEDVWKEKGTVSRSNYYGKWQHQEWFTNVVQDCYSIVDAYDNNEDTSSQLADAKRFEGFPEKPKKHKHKKSKTVGVYVVQESAKNYVKIGVSGNMPSRISSIRTGNPHNVRVICFVQFDKNRTAKIVESQLHVEYQSKRVLGEWFALNESEISDLVCKLNRISCDIKFNKEHTEYQQGTLLV